jgi:hypothetical protein
MIKKDLITASKESWSGEIQDSKNDFPGIDSIKMACLQRIAKAEESKAKSLNTIVAMAYGGMIGIITHWVIEKLFS